MEANIYRKKEDAMTSMKVLSGNPLFSPEIPMTMENFKALTQRLVDAFDLKEIKLPSAEEMRQEMIKMQADVQQELMKRQQIEKLKSVAKHKKGTPEGEAAKKVLGDLEMSGGMPPKGGKGAQGKGPIR